MIYDINLFTSSEFAQELYSKYFAEYKTICEMLGKDSATLNLNLLLAIDKAYKAIMKYTGWTTFDMDYVSATISLAISYFNNENVKVDSANGKRSITQKTEGSRSATYAKASIDFDAFGLTQSVRAMLPLPLLRCL